MLSRANQLCDNARLWIGAGLCLALASISGCTFAPPVQTNRLITQRALIDFTGLKQVQQYANVKVTAAPPVGWDRLALRKHFLYEHEQWRSPSSLTGVGVAYIRTPLPLPADAITWFAKKEYGKKAEDGKILAEWTDATGRAWFEAENKKYHVRGYVATRGNEAWIVYCGYRLEKSPDPSEISLAMRSAETFVPITPSSHAGSSNVAQEPSTQPAIAVK